MLRSTSVVVLICAGLVFTFASNRTGDNMQLPLGNFSISLSVKDIVKSKEFYEKLGFMEVGGNLDKKWVVLKNRSTKIGLFQGMFEKNTLTFNPGWDENRDKLASFMDVREIQQKLLESGVEIGTKADPNTIGPAYIAFVDPDGNPVLIDQHVAK
jgi:lactoylglutathione lyase